MRRVLLIAAILWCGNSLCSVGDMRSVDNRVVVDLLLPQELMKPWNECARYGTQTGITFSVEAPRAELGRAVLATLIAGNNPPDLAIVSEDDADWLFDEGVTISLNAYAHHMEEPVLTERGTIIGFRVPWAEGKWVVVVPIESDKLSAAINAVEGVCLRPLVARILGPERGEPGETLGFDGRESEGDVVTYEWGFGDGERATGPTVQHVYEDPDTYTVVLSVTAADGRTDLAFWPVDVKQSFLGNILEFLRAVFGGG